MNFKKGDLVKPKCNKHMEWLKIGIIMSPAGRSMYWLEDTYEIYWNTGTLERWSRTSVKKWLDKA